jgi:TP901 family phage tail tape measure protein
MRKMTDLSLRILLQAQDMSMSSVVQSAMGTVKKVLSDIASGNITGGIVDALVGIGTAAVGIGIKATQMAADYQQSMNKVQALTGASTDQMNQFDGQLKQLAMETGVAPKALADGLYNVISAGYKGGDAMTVLSLATKDSVIGMTSATVTTDALTNVMASFGKQAKDATGVNGEMLETVTLGKSTFEQYASTIVKSASAASQFHVSMETMNAAFATMTSSGIKAAQASTDFQASLKVMDGNIGTVTKSLNKSGIAFDETKFNAMDYGHQVVYLNSALEEANAKHVKVTGVTLQAAQAINTIAGHISTYNTDLATLSDKQAMAAKTQQAWAITQQGFNVSMQRLQATMQVVMIDLGQKLLPIATGGVNLLNNAFQGLMNAGTYVGNVLRSINLTDFNDAVKAVGVVIQQVEMDFGKLGAALDPIQGDFDPLANTIASLAQGALSTVSGLLWDISGAFIAVDKQVQAGKGPLIELGKAFQNIGNLLKGEIGKELRDVGEDAKQIGTWFMSSVVPAIKQTLPGFESLGKTILTTVIPAAIQIRSVFADVIQHAFTTFAPIIEKIIPPLILLAGIMAGQLSNAIKFLAPYVLQAVKAIGGFADEIMDRVAPIIRNFITGIIPILNVLFNIWKTLWPGMSQVLQGVWNMIVGVVKIAWAIVTGIIKIGLDLLSGNWKQAWTDMLNMFKGILDGINTYLNGSWQALKGIFQTIVNGIVGFFVWLWDTLVGHSIIPDMVNGIINWFIQLNVRAVQAVLQLVTGVLNWFSQLPGKAMGFLNSLPGMINNLWNTIINDAKNAGANIVNGIANGIRGAIGAVGNAISSVANFISSHLPHSPAKVGPLRDLAYQGGQIPQQISEGMVAGVPKIQNAVNKLALPIVQNFNPSAGLFKGGIPTGSTNTTNNSSGTNINIVINVPQGRIDRAGAKQIAEVVKDELTSQLRGGGKLTTQTSGGAQ